ncbi:MAG: class I SAM-dependent methyltransferase [Flavobacteriales bacterium]|nr:class I SAM-dependent methyltransferase [Flavobacteriales bacterium]
MPEPSHAMLKDYFQWEIRSWSRAYPLWHRTLQAMPPEGRHALALGERDGGLSLMLAEHGFTAVCSDLNGPTEQARTLHRTFGWDEAITYEAIDATAIPKADASFDVVVFKSMIGALGSKEKQALAIREMHRVLKPGGVLLFAENLQGTALHRWLRKRFVRWDAYWRYLDPIADRDLFAAFASTELHATGLWANLGRSEGQRDVIARLDALLEPVTPLRWHTIWFGVAIKG